ncbi:hypothetical protein [Novosphingobium sp. FSW06-99]|uniref:hypothetical protein n=1 Tax=Novosphingobium sp. FSW06-99 TaxID=1739113 RepID=UPI00076D38EB|nr:hypothetical protein [Novosphingobium sp. FSW06-99]KUR80931.1 hypothetical protein AQZ49_02595 [Novosphingobium sp. FSW06-99]
MSANDKDVIALRSAIEAAVIKFMDAREAAEVPFANASIDATTALGHSLVLVMAALDDHLRPPIIKLFTDHLAREIERVSATIGSRLAAHGHAR